MTENEEKILQSIQAESKQTNLILAGIAGFLFNLTLWGLLTGLLFGFGFLFAPGFFFTAAGITALVGVALALSSLNLDLVSARPSFTTYAPSKPFKRGQPISNLPKYGDFQPREKETDVQRWERF